MKDSLAPDGGRRLDAKRATQSAPEGGITRVRTEEEASEERRGRGPARWHGSRGSRCDVGGCDRPHPISDRHERRQFKGCCRGWGAHLHTQWAVHVASPEFLHAVISVHDDLDQASRRADQLQGLRMNHRRCNGRAERQCEPQQHPLNQAGCRTPYPRGGRMRGDRGMCAHERGLSASAVWRSDSRRAGMRRSEGRAVLHNQTREQALRGVIERQEAGIGTASIAERKKGADMRLRPILLVAGTPRPSRPARRGSAHCCAKAAASAAGTTS